jgi:hypothetical protein
MAMTWDSHSLSLATSSEISGSRGSPSLPIEHLVARFEYDDRTRKVKASQKVLNAMRKVEAARGQIIARSENPSDLIWELIIICPD